VYDSHHVPVKSVLTLLEEPGEDVGNGVRTCGAITGHYTQD
jgi:hypothetical protein